MKMKKILLMTVMCVVSVLLLSCGGNNDSVEYWKAYVADKNDVQLKRDYIQKRFDSMSTKSDDNQTAYFELAKWTIDGSIFDDDDNEILKSVQSSVDLVNERGSNSSHFGLSETARESMQSNPEMFIENACKIIGPIEDLKKEIASHVEAKKVEKIKVADFDSYNVLYSIDDKLYVICCITEKGNGQSEIQMITKNKSINEILDYWQAMH